MSRAKNQMSLQQMRAEAKRTQVRKLKRRILEAGLPEPEEEVRFHAWRRWRYDLSYTKHKIAIEYEGGTWSGKSRHTSPKGYRNDAEKYTEGAILGWLVVRITADMLRDGMAVDMVRRALEARGAIEKEVG